MLDKKIKEKKKKKPKKNLVLSDFKIIKYCLIEFGLKKRVKITSLGSFPTGVKTNSLLVLTSKETIATKS